MKQYICPIGWSLLLVVGLAARANASPTDELRRCRLITDPAARLVCYDRIGPATAGAPAAELPPATPTQPTADPALVPLPASAGGVQRTSPEALFGIDSERSQETLLQAAGIARLDEIEMRLSAVSLDAAGKPLLEFDNGQVWRQLDSPPARLKVGTVVRIRRAAFGSFLLLRPDGGRGIRVRRVN